MEYHNSIDDTGVHVCFINTNITSNDFANFTAAVYTHIKLVDIDNCPMYSPYNPCTLECFPNHSVLLIDSVMRTKSSLITYGTVYPILFVLTAIANALIVAVLSRPVMRTATNRLLLYMAAADCAVAAAPFSFVVFYIHLKRYESPEQLEAWWCRLALASTDAMPPACHNVAIWLAVLLAGQRWLVIAFPTKPAIIRSLNITRINIASAVVVVISLLCASPKVFDKTDLRAVKWRVYQNGSDGMAPRAPREIAHSYQCIFRFSSIVTSAGIDNYYMVYYWVRVALFVLLPCTLLIIFSVLLILNIHRANKRRASLQKARPPAQRPESTLRGVSLSDVYHEINGKSHREPRVPIKPSDSKKTRTGYRPSGLSGMYKSSMAELGRLAIRRSTSPGNSHVEVSSPSTMLVLIVIIFLAVNLPQGIILALVCLQETFPGTIRLNPSIITIVTNIDNMLILATFPLNFAIYTSMSSQFRDTFKKLLFGKWLGCCIKKPLEGSPRKFGKASLLNRSLRDNRGSIFDDRNADHNRTIGKSADGNIRNQTTLPVENLLELPRQTTIPEDVAEDKNGEEHMFSELSDGEETCV